MPGILIPLRPIKKDEPMNKYIDKYTNVPTNNEMKKQITDDKSGDAQTSKKRPSRNL